MRRLTLEQMQALAKERGGRCLSRVYVNRRTKLRWQCKKGHEWETTPDTVQQGSWCPHCGGRKRLTIRHMQTWAKKRGGVCVSTEYSDAHTKLRWRCQEGHEWESKPNYVQQGNWCPQCGGSAPLTLDEMQAVARSRGGECLSPRYVNTLTKLKWRCQEGHEWEAAPGSVKLGRWCPTCSQGNSERIVRDICEQMFGKPCPKIKPKWLINSRGNLMELDGYCSELSLAFEYQGIQHYEETKFSRRSPMRRTLGQQKKDDARKRKLCLENDVHLIEIPYKVTLSDVPTYLFRKVKGLRAAVGMKRPEEVEVAQFVLPEHLRVMRALARKRGGKCLSTAYLGTHARLRWRCQESHEWDASPSSVKSGSWCPECAGTAKLTLQQMQALAIDRGGECLSPRYVSNKTKLLWRCQEGHEWEAAPQDVKSGSWCPRCGTARIAAALRATIEEMQAVARDRGGECLSPQYVNTHTKLLWRCRKSHEWEAKPHDIKQGTWCPTCAGRPRITMEQMHALALERGGTCLSTAYANNRTRLRWRCAEGHEWEATPMAMKVRVNWCTKCRES